MKTELYKHNSIIGTGLTLSLQEERCINVILGDVYKKTELSSTIFYEADIQKYMERTGLEKKHAYKELKQVGVSLLKAVFGVEQDDGSILYTQVAHKVLVNDANYTVSIQWNKEAIPLLSGFKYGNFTVIPGETTKFSSINVHNLYQILKKESWKGEFIVGLLELQKKLGVSYKLFGDFRIYVIEKGIKEIEKLGDLKVEVSYIKTGRAVSHVRFRMGKEEPTSL